MVQFFFSCCYHDEFKLLHRTDEMKSTCKTTTTTTTNKKSSLKILIGARCDFSLYVWWGFFCTDHTKLHIRHLNCVVFVVFFELLRNERNGNDNDMDLCVCVCACATFQPFQKIGNVEKYSHSVWKINWTFNAFQNYMLQMMRRETKSTSKNFFESSVQKLENGSFSLISNGWR